MKLIIKFLTDKAKETYLKAKKVGSNVGADKLLFKTMFKEKTLSTDPLMISIKARQPRLLKHILQQNNISSLPDLVNKFLNGEGLKTGKDYTYGGLKNE